MPFEGYCPTTVKSVTYDACKQFKILNNITFLMQK